MRIIVDFSYLFIEIAILIFSILFFVFLCKRKSQKMSAACALFASLFLETANNFLDSGTFYPRSLLYFPFMKFPVAILLLSSLYGSALVFTAFKIVEKIESRPIKFILFFSTILLLNLLSLPIEHLGVSSGYWIHKKALDLSLIYPQIYLFYLIAALAATIPLSFEIFKPAEK